MNIHLKIPLSAPDLNHIFADVRDTDEMLAEEFVEIEKRRAAQTPQAVASHPPETPSESAKRLKLTALCLSGGGIRSAAFCLGVLQSLAAKRLLNQFDYLSTVSGGGFIGGWLQMAMSQATDMDKFQEALATPSVPPLQRLRAYTNYLTPQTGPLSLDSWASIALYLRNLILNWMIFAPLFLVLALVPIFYRTVMAAGRDSFDWNTLSLAVGVVALTVAAWQGSTLLPSHRSASSLSFASTKAIAWRVVAPAVVWAFLVPLAIDHGLRQQRLAPPGGVGLLARVEWSIPACYVLAMLAGYALAWGIGADKAASGRDLYGKNVWRWFAATLCIAGLTWLGLHFAQPGGMLYQAAADGGPTQHRLLPDSETALTLLFPPWLLTLHVLQKTFYVGFRREALFAYLDREWLARVSGLVLQIGAGWTLLALSCVELTRLLWLVTDTQPWAGSWLVAITSGTTLLGGVIAWLGKIVSTQIETQLIDTGRWKIPVLNALCITFAIGVFVVAGSVLQTALGVMQLHWLNRPGSDSWLLVLQLGLAVVLVLLVLWFGRVNVNRFSLHAVYRNRLTRAFLGSARATRNPDAFTGFDPNDSPRVISLKTQTARQRLFAIINITLNETSSGNTAWAERKAQSFVATPLACGAASLRNPNPRQNDSVAPLGAFVPSSLFAGKESRYDERGLDQGPHLGSMLTVSGAAVGPNWGYHSSQLTAFVMTLFNARLGVWLPNPSMATPLQRQLAKPSNSIAAIVSELLGMSSDSRQAVYLSDGGHFENLGLYEMLRRRCKQILVIDAGQDGSCGFFDLGNAIRKARIDVGAEVTMRPMAILSRDKIESSATLAGSALGFAVGDIVYPDGGTGMLVYLKPSFLPDIPADVRAYGLSDPEFPHNSTLDQWFTESRFESYRKLGYWQMDQLVGALARDSAALDGLFAAAESQCRQSQDHGADQKPKAV